MSVVSQETLEQNADSNLINFLATMPAVTGAATAATQTAGISPGLQGIESLNLRGLGSNRVLVLLDGQRTSPASYGNAVDTATFPSQLISRVDVVTGGASAVYGSDAVSGVVNFVLDRKFTGLKGEISGGITNFGDDKNYKINLSAGFAFGPDSRGHILLAGGHTFNQGIRGSGGRKWAETGVLTVPNPTYTATNGQPLNYIQAGSGPATTTLGGIIVAGPLKGTAFGAGGVPYKFNYGTAVSGALMTGGGDWADSNTVEFSDIDPVQTNENFYTRVSYDVTDNINVFAQWIWTQNRTRSALTYPQLAGTATTYVIKLNNAYLPASTRAAMVATGQTQFGIGTWMQDYGLLWNNNTRMSIRATTGFEGKFDAFGSSWNWNAYYAYGGSKITLRNRAPITARFQQSIDAVVNPANGQIVCQSTLTAPTNGCKPFNAMGIGVNKMDAGLDSWLNEGGPFQHGLLEQTVYAASVSGEPFSIWAGPVSVAASVEHRKDEVNAQNDLLSATPSHPAGNYASLVGAQSVTEGALESIIPLAKNESWAQNWDLSLAVRFTGYELAGYVTTWKVGTTYTLNDDIKLRFTRSRDIRAPTLSDLFATPQFSVQQNLRDSSNNPPTVVQGTVFQATLGNPNVKPEKADTTGIGVVLSPTFIEGFTASVDYWDVDISGAIQSIGAQQTIDLCYSGQATSLCPNIIRNSIGQISQVNLFPINLAVQDVRGIDLEMSYRLPLSSIVSDWRGDFSIHGNMTFYLRNYQDTTLAAPTDSAGQNSGAADPNWKLSATATYALDPVRVSLTGRAFSSGTINNSYITCTSGCPTSTADHPTYNYNYMPGRFYLDANVDYKLDIGDAAQANVFLSVRNMFNSDPPPYPSGTLSTAAPGLGALYDTFGTIYRIGVRFKM